MKTHSCFFRIDSVRNYMKRNKMGKFSEEAKQAAEKEKEKEEQQTARALTFKVGERCQTTVPKNPVRRGVVMFIGKWLL